MYSEGVLKDGLSKVPKLNKCFASVFTKDNNSHRAKTSWVTEMNVQKQK